MTSELLHLDFSYWPICQGPNQCGLLHNELLIYLILLPEATKIYQNAISTFIPPFFSCPGAERGRNVQEMSIAGCPGVPLVYRVLVHGVSLNQ